MKRLAFAALFATAFSTAVFAKEGGNDPFAACKADFERYCKSVHPGDGRIVKCMMENKSRVSSGCQAVLEKKQQHEQQANKPKNIKTSN
jgi:hypothetical protein